MGSIMGLLMIGIILFYFAIIPAFFMYLVWQTIRFFQQKKVYGGKAVLAMSYGFLFGSVGIVSMLF